MQSQQARDGRSHIHSDRWRKQRTEQLTEAEQCLAQQEEERAIWAACLRKGRGPLRAGKHMRGCKTIVALGAARCCTSHAVQLWSAQERSLSCPRSRDHDEASIAVIVVAIPRENQRHHTNLLRDRERVCAYGQGITSVQVVEAEPTYEIASGEAPYGVSFPDDADVKVRLIYHLEIGLNTAQQVSNSMLTFIRRRDDNIMKELVDFSDTEVGHMVHCPWRKIVSREVGTFSEGCIAVPSRPKRSVNSV